VLVFGMLVCIRLNRSSRYNDGIIFPDDDVRENIIHYDEEGVGETVSLYRCFFYSGLFIKPRPRSGTGLDALLSVHPSV